jgi:hypothetical protein
LEQIDKLSPEFFDAILHSAFLCANNFGETLGEEARILGCIKVSGSLPFNF